AVGGRYQTESSDTTCALATGGGFELAREPWLVPGFVAGTEIDPAAGVRYRYECRDAQQPFGAEGALTGLNLGLAASNPVPDGNTRRRRIELLDGALVNQEELLILFRETFEESFLGAESEEFS